ncbi:MAG: DUF924 family protein [Pseudomonadota bacterium]
MGSLENDEALSLLDFWIGAGPKAWFMQDDAFDTRCAGYRDLWEKARAGACDDWAQTAAGALALTILLDQIPRNVLRGSAEQFATDAKAVTVADAAVAAGFDRAFMMPLRFFFYLPYEHAEDNALQDRCLDLVRPLNDQEFYYWALVHADAIRRFGRFPHRNKMLGRETTPAEQAYLDSGGFGADK